MQPVHIQHANQGVATVDSPLPMSGDFTTSGIVGGLQLA